MSESNAPNTVDENNDHIDDVEIETEEAKPPANPVRKATFVILILALLLMAWYLGADRNTPYTTQARVHAQVVPVASEVSGTVSEVMVKNNQLVAAGDPLFRIDAGNYDLALENALASLQTAQQGTGVSTANVDAAEASLRAARRKSA